MIEWALPPAHCADNAQHCAAEPPRAVHDGRHGRVARASGARVLYCMLRELVARCAGRDTAGAPSSPTRVATSAAEPPRDASAAPSTLPPTDQARAAANVSSASPATSSPSASDATASRQLEERARQLFRDIRCVECDNGQSVEYSNSDMAVELRHLVRDMLYEGASTDTVRDYISQQYGERVWYAGATDKLGLSVVAFTFGATAIVALGIGAQHYVGPTGSGVGGRMLARCMGRRGRDVVSARMADEVTKYALGPEWRWSTTEQRGLARLLRVPDARAGGGQ